MIIELTDDEVGLLKAQLAALDAALAKQEKKADSKPFFKHKVSRGPNNINAARSLIDGLKRKLEGVM